MVQRAGRVTCPKCGANNFDTVSTCYRCQASLVTGGMSPSSAPGNSAPMMDRAARPTPAMNSAINPAMSAPIQPPIMPSAVPPPYMPNYGGGNDGDPALARRAAVWLALTIPWIGLPVGWTFMMMEDRKRQAIGRYCVNWSLIALVFHLLLTFVFMQSVASYLPLALSMTKALQNQQNPQKDTGLPNIP